MGFIHTFFFSALKSDECGDVTCGNVVWDVLRLPLVGHVTGDMKRCESNET